MTIIDALEVAWAQGAPLVADLDPERLTGPTACSDWDVRSLLDHTLGECQMMTRVNRGENLRGTGPSPVGGGDVTSTWARVGAANVASWRASGLVGDRTYFYGTFPASAGALINVGEVVVHSWDLACATDQDWTLDPALAELVHGLYSSVPLDGMRRAGQLGPEIPVADDAPIGDRMLGLLGRQPR